MPPGLESVSAVRAESLLIARAMSAQPFGPNSGPNTGPNKLARLRETSRDVGGRHFA